MFRALNQFLKNSEWRLALGTFVWQAAIPAGSFALPAWATWVTGVFSEYAPLTWVIAGFVGFFAYSMIVFIHGAGRSRSVRSRYDASFLRETGGVDPLAKVFEDKRIFLNDFVLPSHAFVEDRTFVNCEIVGPANMYFEFGNGVDNVKPHPVDAVALNGERRFSNGVTFRNCRFRGCTFHRITIFLHPSEIETAKGADWLNWISPMPVQTEMPGTEPPIQIADQSGQPREAIEEEKTR